MAQAVDQARRERELTKESVAADLDKLESKVRHELDFKARLRRDGARYAVFGGIAIAALIATSALRKKKKGKKDSDEIQITSLDDVAQELQSLRAQVNRGKREKESGSLVQKIAVRGVTAAATAAGTMAARQFMGRFGPDPEDSAEHSSKS